MKMGDHAFREAIENARGDHRNVRAGDLTRWLNRHYIDILSLRARGDSWKPYIEQARREGVQITDSPKDLRRIRKIWVLVKAMRQRADAEHAALPRSGARPNAPSRHTPKDWRPAYQVVSGPAGDPDQHDAPGSSGDVVATPSGQEPVFSPEPEDFSKKSSEVASLPATVSPTRSTAGREAETLRVGQARVEEILRQLDAEERAQERRYAQE